jgi:hypothetical protein
MSRKRKLQVNLGELKDESDELCNFLSLKLDIDGTSNGNKPFGNLDVLSSNELKRLVNNFVYHHHFNNKYWAELKDNIVKNNKFERFKKEKKEKEVPKPSTVKHGW